MEKKAFRRIGLATFLVGAFWAGGSILLGYLYARYPAFFVGRDGIQLIQYLLMYGIATMILWLILRGLPKLDGEPKRKLGCGKFFGYASVMRGTALVLSLIGMLFYLIAVALIQKPENLFDALLGGNPLYGNPSTWINMVLICVIAPIVEELMFRKLLMDALRPFGDTVAILYSGIAFGLLHMNIQQIFYAAGLGLVMGYVMTKTNNIWHCIGLHFVMNASSAVILPFINNMQSFTHLIPVGIYAGVLIVVSIVGLVLFFVKLKKIRLEKPRFRFMIPINAKLVLFNPGTIPYILVCFAMSLYRIYSM